MTPLTAKTGNSMAGKSNRAGKMLPATGKRTGRITHITHAKIGKNTGTTTITAAAIGEAVTMGEDTDTRRGEYSRAWQSAL